MEKTNLREQRKKIQQLLREMRTTAGLHQVELADQLGQYQSFVSKYESGERNLDMLEIREICKVVGITLMEFVERLEKRLG